MVWQHHSLFVWVWWYMLFQIECDRFFSNMNVFVSSFTSSYFSPFRRKIYKIRWDNIHFLSTLNSKQTPTYITVEDELLGVYWGSLRKNGHNIYSLHFIQWVMIWSMPVRDNYSETPDSECSVNNFNITQSNAYFPTKALSYHRGSCHKLLHKYKLKVSICNWYIVQQWDV